MTSLKRRLDNVLAELAIIQEGLEASNHYSSCCLTIHDDNKISCDTTGPLPKEEFLKECQKCKDKIEKILACLNLNEIENKIETL